MIYQPFSNIIPSDTTAYLLNIETTKSDNLNEYGMINCPKPPKPTPINKEWLFGILIIMYLIIKKLK